MDPMTRVDGTEMMTGEEQSATAGGAPDTVPPTTVPPTTVPPTTVPPTTVPPTTVPPTTVPPTTVPPTTVPPTTVPPTTVPPTTVPPTTVPPTTVPPTTVPPRNLDEKKDDIIENLIFWCDSSLHGDDDDTVKPQNDPNAVFMEVEKPDYYKTAEPEEKAKTVLFHIEAVQLVKALSASTNQEGLLDLVRRVLPVGIELSPRKLLAAVHPDRFTFDDENIREKAHQVFVGE